MVNVNFPLYANMLDKFMYGDAVYEIENRHAARDLFEVPNNILYILYGTIKQDIINIRKIKRLKRELYDLEYIVKNYSQLSHAKNL